MRVESVEARGRLMLTYRRHDKSGMEITIEAMIEDESNKSLREPLHSFLAAMGFHEKSIESMLRGFE